MALSVWRGLCPRKTKGLVDDRNFYDGNAAYAARRSDYYRRRAKMGVFIWRDIATDPSCLVVHNISQADALRRLHARDASGAWHIGVDAFIVIWRQIGCLEALRRYWCRPGVKQLADTAYNRFADYRFARLDHCQIAGKWCMPERALLS